ncbi:MULTISPECIES: hypothetical protein [Planktothricoides]|uniref:Uncharacterized protein n=1 Tax=Planktothricoides raciborskii FACHB-1370 TaxID=2949576 RepID=A0ABR8EKH1_9CYAN|nr:MULTISPECIES: hypothetical protein [Planktothricoides]MBD2547248.1 hypothetical protein [Planktothricoides raciborskii FACHB-1370]MBD2585750.1 hypothetical protein [Planktothricoides raciborskii FACHB-1261]
MTSKHWGQIGRRSPVFIRQRKTIRPQIIHYSFPLPVSIIRQNCLIFCEQNIVIYYGQQLEYRTDRESSVNLDYDQSLD